MKEEFATIVLKMVEEIPLLMPEILAKNWPDQVLLSEFPSYCGAGEGLQEKAIPETFYGQSQSHNCFIHDITHTIFKPTRNSFHLSNMMLLQNCLSTIRVKSNPLMKYLRERRALKYYDGVETEIGFRCFLNREGGNVGQSDYDPLNDPSFIAKLRKVGVVDPWED